MSFIIKNNTGSAVTINDLGLTVPASGTIDLRKESPEHIAESGQTGGDLFTLLSGGTPTLSVLDPLDGVTPLDSADSIKVTQVANDPHYRIVGGRLGDIDDVDTSGASASTVYLLTYDDPGSGDVWMPVLPSTVIGGEVNLGDLKDATDPIGPTSKVNTRIYLFKGNGAGELTVVDGTTDPDYTELVQDIIGNTFQNGSDTTFVYNDVANTMQINVDDSYLRNDGDTLDSGTLTIASGATIDLVSGSTITIQDGATANVITPTGGFTGGNSIVNKAYVDGVSAGLDPKESVRTSTAPTEDLLTGSFGGSYATTPSNGQFTGVDLSSATGGSLDGMFFTGTATTGLVVGDRVLVKDETSGVNPTYRNGIYEITAAPAANNVTLTRAADQDGSPAHEVSGGNFTFIEDKSAILAPSAAGTQDNTGWVVIWDGIITLNSDPVVWSQFTGTGALTTGIGISQAGNVIDLDVDDLVVASIQTTAGDLLAFHDADGSAETSGSQTRKITIENFLTDLEIPNNVGGNGIIVRTSPGSFAARTIIGSTTHATNPSLTGLEGISIGRGDGVAGDPEVGLDILGLNAVGRNMAAADLFVLYDGTNNESITGQQIADGVTGIAGFQGYGQIANDGTTITAQSANELVTFVGTGIGITGSNSGTPGLDTLTFAMDIADLTAGTGPLIFTDEIAVNDGGTTLRFTFDDVVDDLDIPHGITSNGLVVRDGADSYTNRSIAVDGAGNKDGLSITDGDGAAGNPTLGLDITNGLPAAGEDLAAADEVAVYNASATANEKMTGQEIADGVVNIIFGSTNVTITNINGQPTMVFDDSTRSNKTLSVSELTYQWSEAQPGDSDWLNIGNSIDATTGYTMPMDATVVRASIQCADNKGVTKNFDLYIDGVLDTASILTISGASAPKTDYDETLDIDIDQGEVLQMRAGATGGQVEDVVVTLWVKWRA